MPVRPLIISIDDTLQPEGLASPRCDAIRFVDAILLGVRGESSFSSNESCTAVSSHLGLLLKTTALCPLYAAIVIYLM